MKAGLIIIFFVSIQFPCLSQGRYVKTATPCDSQLLKNTPGLWIQAGNRFFAKIPKQLQQEIINRIDKLHLLTFDVYPKPLGIDVAWYRGINEYDFGGQVKTERLTDGKTREILDDGIPIVSYSYLAKFYGYGCGRDKYTISRGYPAEGGASFLIAANSPTISSNDYGGLEGMQVEGRRIKLMPHVKGKWKGITLYETEQGSASTMVLLHREGMVPYIPVTRKQYLELSIKYLTRFFDNAMADWDKSAKGFIASGLKPDPADKEKIEKQKKAVLKYYQDELAATTSAGLLDTPAKIFGSMCHTLTQYPIFAPDTDGGRLLFTENPVYFRKDLPKYVPQCFVVAFETTQWLHFTPKQDPIPSLNENFPIEKLQAMIDK